MPEWLPALIMAPFAGRLVALLVHWLPRDAQAGIAPSCCAVSGRPPGPLTRAPLLSALARRSRCPGCGAPIRPAYGAIDLACLGIAAWSVLAEADPLRVWLSCGLGWAILALAWIDWDHLLLPDALTLPLLLAGLGATWLLDPLALTDHAVAAAAGYLAFRAIERGYRWLRGRDGLGQGDAKLLAAAGAWVGVAALPLLVCIAALSGIALVAVLRLLGRPFHGAMVLPFGPALCIGLWTVWLGIGAAGR
ncbi:prepilin peptidase [Belnapia rosea]|uniref:Prepilin leader peptidase/N-methyltransferase n=1 Tax=Belnapia rosea TaxID=938405 RepID=A0A1G7DR72_9PROT|nr:A24 family peptidase [Belnapia rosea]SDB74764.1 leader peptidase (prepilin peptidase) / N-methyltransferase [Belnapia rosea]SDE53979.1 leader peptidase (prepilin peptidase) / N-methyltransferase [Belnapia rosea]